MKFALLPLAALLTLHACGGADPKKDPSSETDTDTDTDSDTDADADADADADTDSDSDSDTGTGPTSGPGVLAGETGLEAFCRRYVECGGTYYADQQACIDASVGYWGDCEEVMDALNAFGACMAEVDCNDYNPDAYNPSGGPCDDEWSDLGRASCG